MTITLLETEVSFATLVEGTVLSSKSRDGSSVYTSLCCLMFYFAVDSRRGIRIFSFYSFTLVVAPSAVSVDFPFV